MKSMFFCIMFLSMFLLPNAIFSQTNAATKENKIETIKVQTNLHCLDCKQKIETELASVRGVKEADADVATKIVTVKFSNTQTNKDEIVSRIQKVGYQAKAIENNGCKSHQTSCNKSNQNSCCKNKAGEKDAKCCKDKTSENKQSSSCCKAKADANSSSCGKK